jgi:hypothetical protein
MRQENGLCEIVFPRNLTCERFRKFLGISVTWLRFCDDSLVSKGKAITPKEEMLLTDFRCLTKNTQTHISSLIRSLAVEEKKRK